jgi:hypothetical protein
MSNVQLSAFTVSPNLFLTGQVQSNTFNHLISQYQIVNNSIPTDTANSNNMLELLNANSSGYRFHQKTIGGVQRGDLILSQFNNGSIPGIPLLTIQEATGNFILSLQGGAFDLNNGNSVTPLRFFDPTGTYYSGFQAGSLTGSTTWTLPIQDSVGIQALCSNGAGVLSFRSLDTMPWIIQNTSIVIGINNQYITNSSSLVVLTLPSVCPVGSEFQVVGEGTGGWKIAQNSGQQIIFGDISTTSGTGGYISNTSTNDCARIVCTIANTKFIVYNVVGNITYN